MVALAGCAGVSGRVSVDAARLTGNATHGSKADVVGDIPGVPLQEALETVGRDVPLPDHSVAGLLQQAIVDPTAGDLDDHPGLYLIYKSGVELTVSRRTHELSDLGTGFAPFTDGRKTHFEPRVIGGMKALVGRAGLQKHSHGENYVPPMVRWNQSDLGYTLVGPTLEFAIEDLVQIMESTR
jgi:hypothetical protein